MKYLLILFTTLTLMFSCKSQQYTPDTYEERQVMFGSGGGFTGAVTTYCLLDNGQLFLKPNLKEPYEAAGKVSKKDVAAVFAMIEEQELTKITLSMPGNMYNFVEIKADGASNSCTWDPANPQKTPSGMKDLHQMLMGLTKPSK